MRGLHCERVCKMATKELNSWTTTKTKAPENWNSVWLVLEKLNANVPNELLIYFACFRTRLRRSHSKCRVWVVNTFQNVALLGEILRECPHFASLFDSLPLDEQHTLIFITLHKWLKSLLNYMAPCNCSLWSDSPASVLVLLFFTRSAWLAG